MATPNPKDAIALLKADHRAVEEKFAKFERLGDRASKSKEALVAEVIKALSAHAAIEEAVFYPALRERMPQDDDLVLESLEEHHVVKWTLSELDSMQPDHERYDAKFTVLMESVRHHVREEEGELFPKVRKAFSRAELIELGQELTAAKTKAPKKPHPRAADEPPLNTVFASVSRPMDEAIERMRQVGKSAVRKVRKAVAAR